MRISIHQPAYLPWLGYVDKVLHSDMFVVLDTVSFSKNSFDNRNKIVLNGKDFWLTIPVKHQHGQVHTDIKMASTDWIKTHPMTLYQAYHKSEYWDRYRYILDIYKSIEGNLSLADVCWSLLYHVVKPFADEKKIHFDAIRSSYLDKTNLKGSELILDICKKLNATEYYSGIMGKDYLDEKAFSDAGIKIVYQEYKPEHNYACLHQLFVNGPVL